MEQEHRRIKRAEVSDETRRGRRRAAVNPNARRSTDEIVDDVDEREEHRERRAARRGGASR